jgi:hypothetical protein
MNIDLCIREQNLLFRKDLGIRDLAESVSVFFRCLLFYILFFHGVGLEDRMALTQTENWQDDATARISGLSYNYRGLIEVPVGTATDWEPAIGDRVPDVNISEHLRLHYLLAHTRFTLLGVLGQAEGEQLTHATAALAAVQERFAACIQFELIAPAVAHPWSGLLPIADPEGNVVQTLNVSANGEFVLVRPMAMLAFGVTSTNTLFWSSTLSHF